MINGLLVDDNISNLTTASNEDASISSGNRNEGATTLYQHQQSVGIPNQPAAAKRKRNQPGNPDPEAEVVALSPTTLMVTNRFMCEICNKGFKRDQNLQLHRRGHNLPWKLKQKANNDQVKKKVYICPVTTCVHHDPLRALGDLTGIKKHFFRKHGEKKWKCEKCSKRYAVQSDWKAHFKICGTREYRCDCGTIFSRRDSFITHRAFCDALTEEGSRANMPNTIQQNPHMTSNSHFSIHPYIKTELQDPQNSHFVHPPWLSTQTGSNNNHNIDQLFSQNSNPHMSATALLQKAAQMGVTVSQPQGQNVTSGLYFSSGPASATAMSNGSGNMVFPPLEGMFAPFLGKANVSGNMEQVPTTVYEMSGNLPSFEEAFGGILNQKMGDGDFQEAMFSKTSLGKGRDQDLTRDFLGLKVLPQGGFATMAGLDHQNNSKSLYDQHSLNHQSNSIPLYDQHNQNQTPWQG